MMVAESKARGRRISRHLALLKNDDVDRWFRDMRSGSEETARVWLAAVGRVLEWARKRPRAPLMGPEDLLSLTGDAATRLLEDYRSAHTHVRSLCKT